MRKYIRQVKTKSGATAVQIEYRVADKRVKLVHIGSAKTDLELEVLLKIAEERILDGQLRIDFSVEEESDLLLEKSYSGLLWDSLVKAYNQLGFSQINDLTFQQLVLARIIEPVSKLDTIRVLDELGLDAPSNTSIHRCLKRINENNYRDSISDACIDYAKLDTLSLVLYDVTTLYFEIQKEDDYRKSGLSKERRLEPQITLGLLVDHKGFPLELQSFEGNRAEVHTILPVLASFRDRHKLENITVTADAAMLSSSNIAELEALGYHYIIGSRLTKTPYEIDDYLDNVSDQLVDGQIFESTIPVTVNGKRSSRRAVYQYREKRARLDLSNIDKTLAKAEKMVSNKANVKRNRFLSVTGDKREINQKLVDRARRHAGIKGYITDLDIPGQQVIDAYHSLFQVEKSFRMSKSDLRARPIFHHKRESIEAHLTVVFAGLAVARYLEELTKISIKKFVNTLKPIRTGIVSLNGQTYPIKAKVPDQVQELLDKVDSKNLH